MESQQVDAKHAYVARVRTRSARRGNTRSTRPVSVTRHESYVGMWRPLAFATFVRT